MNHNIKYLLPFTLIAFITLNASAQNPLITNMYSAHPSARVYGDSMYVYPSHDILATPGHGRVGWFCMEDYHGKKHRSWASNRYIIKMECFI
ncbi:MAG: hypothetical protein ABI863_17235 [Ginsengibacter sp.]